MKTSSSLYSEASGPIGSVEFSRTAAGVTLRNKPVYKAPQTIRQAQNRSTVAAAAVAWTNMTTEARESYRLAALRVPQLDKFGRVFYLSGWNFFCRRWLTFSPYFPDFYNKFTAPIDLNLVYSIGHIDFKFFSRPDGSNFTLQNNSVSDVFISYLSSDIYSNFRTESPIYKFQASYFFPPGVKFFGDFFPLTPGRYYLKFLVLDFLLGWSTILLPTVDVE